MGAWMEECMYIVGCLVESIRGGVGGQLRESQVGPAFLDGGIDGGGGSLPR
jgi:hypothetical protein